MNHDTYADAYLKRVLEETKTIAMVGASPNWNRPSYFVMKYLQTKGFKVYPVNPRATGEEILGAQNLVRRVVMAPHVQDYAIRMVMASHPGGPFAIDATNRYVRWGASPRAAQAVTLCAKLYALMDGRFNASFSDIQRSYIPSMRHRVLMNFEGEAEGINIDEVLRQVIEQTPTMAEAAA